MNRRFNPILFLTFETLHRGLQLENKRYSHLIYPNSGFTENRTRSATILIPPSKDSGIKSDVFSKPLFIAKTKNKINIAKSLNINYFLIIMNNNSILISKSMNDKIKWEENIDKKNITIY